VSAGSGTADRAAALPRLPPGGRLLLKLLERIRGGSITLSAPGLSPRRFGAADGQPALHADLVLHDWKICRDVLLGGDVAFAEAYMDRRWETTDLVALLTVIAHNQGPLNAAFYGRGWRAIAFRLAHRLRGNSRRGARRNIVAHYDLGNDFYRLWLDPTMTYSSALYGGDPTRTLEAAQRAKVEAVLDLLGLQEGARVLEIGAGWGGFAEAAARRGLRVTGISLSDAQTAYARERIARQGFSDRVEFRIQDYRDVRERFDGVASIEMFEAVGERYWPAYFAAVRRALGPGARAVVQAITIAEDRFDQYRNSSDFIQQYIFPGGMLASPSVFEQAARAERLDTVVARRFGHDYSRTLCAWLASFDAHADAIRAQGFGVRFMRCWRFYLAYCAAGFASDTTDVAQYVLSAR
jgi:cyclopropane-fatty-acyl-phospholipid synthase